MNRLLGVLLLAGCATLPPIGVSDADERTVQSCRFVGEVHGSSGWGGVAASTGMGNAKNEARTQAARLGASHIVWRSVDGGVSPSASGRAYSCR